MSLRTKPHQLCPTIQGEIISAFETSRNSDGSGEEFDIVEF